MQNRKLLAKVVGFDASLFEQINKSNKNPQTPTNTPNNDDDSLSPR